MGKRGTYNIGKPLLESGKWALLGGFVSRDETLKEAVKREVEEESGWKISGLKLFLLIDNPNRPGEDRQNISVIFLAKADSQISNHDEEITSLEWFDLENIPSKDTIAFDHWNVLQLYKKYTQEKFNLPLGS